MSTSDREYAQRRASFLKLASRWYDRMHASAEQHQLVTFDQREQRALELGAEVEGALLQEHLQRDPLTRPKAGGECTCPSCGTAGARPEADVERQVRTRAGPVRWARVRYYCRHCRRHFSPSRQHLAPGRGRL